MEEEVLPEEKKAPKKPKKKKKQEELLTISNRCKNCEAPLNLDQAFCPSCGAKRMYNRLNWNNLTEDFADRFLNIENNFLRTFIAMFTKPDEVIGGYINGLRKRYLSAFSYFAISLTLSGLYLFVFRKWFLNDDIIMKGMDTANSPGAAGIAKETMSIMNWIFEYQSVITFVNIPFYALVSKLVFWNYKKYNFIEHVVIYLYIYSHTQIIASVFGILLIWSYTVHMTVSFILMFAYLGYAIYVLMRLFDLTIEKIVLKTLLFFVVFGVLSLIFFGLGGWLFYKVGFFDSFIGKVKEIETQQRSLREAAKTLKDSIRMDSIRQLTKRVKDTVLLFGS